MRSFDERPAPTRADHDETADTRPTTAEEWDQKFRDDLAVDTAFEAGLLFKEMWIVAIIVVLIVLREVLL